jgi:maltose O-acetyltransferase
MLVCMTDSNTGDGPTQRDRMLAGEPYRSDSPELVDAHRRAMRLLGEYNRTPPDATADRDRLLGELLGSIGAESTVRSPFLCDYGTYLHIGARTFVNFGLVALDAAPIVIGDDVQIGPNVQLLTPTHPIDAQRRRAKWEGAEPIAVGDNVWLGGGVIVLPGVRIGENAVVGAGAVVTTDVPAGVVAVGNPCRVIRTL